MAPRNATLMCGMLNIPVKLQKTVKGTAVTKGTRTKLLHSNPGCFVPIEMPKCCPACGKTHLQPDELVPGVEVKKVWRPVDLDDAPVTRENGQPQPITITKFVYRSSLSPERFSDSYWLIPSIIKPYTLLCDGLSSAGDFVGFGFTTPVSKESPCVVESFGGVLMLKHMHHDEDMVDCPFTPDELPMTSAAELEEVVRFIHALKGDVEPEEITTSARQWREQQIALQAGVDPVEVASIMPTEEVDVIEQLRKSIELAEKLKKQPKKVKA